MFGRFWGKDSISFSIFGKSNKIDVTIKENGKGGLDFKLKFAKGGDQDAGLESFVFDLGDPGLCAGLSMKGASGKFAPGQVKKAATKAFAEEKASGDESGFDVAVTPEVVDEEPVQEMEFTLEHAEEDLQIEDILGMDMGIQIAGSDGEVEDIAVAAPEESEDGASPLADTPLTEEVEAEVAAAEAAAAEAAAEEPAAEEPVAEEPVAEEPVAEEPVAEEPVAEEPVAEEPVAEEPVAEEPVAEEPIILEPVDPGIDPEFQDVLDGELDETSGDLLFLNEDPGYFEDSGLTAEEERDLFMNEGVTLL